MHSGWDFFWTVAASSVGSTALLSAAAFFLKAQIGHWLNKDLEATKNVYQQQLEAYKVSLIAESERAKAVQSVKTAGALKLIDHKFRFVGTICGCFLACRRCQTTRSGTDTAFYTWRPVSPVLLH